MRVAAAELHEAVAARRIGLGGDAGAELAGQIPVAEFVDVFHGWFSAFMAAISANRASVRSASSGSMVPMAWPTCTMT